MSPHRLKLMVSLILIVATIGVFWQVRNHDFLYYDDNLYVTENYHVLAGLTPEGIVWAFTTSHASNWHPISWLSHMMDCQIYGLNASEHHLTNLLFHIINTLLLFGVFERMTRARWRSALIAALFAVHPLHVESVAWVAERKDVLSTLFWFSTMWAYMRYVECPGFTRHLLVFVLFALGLMAKPMLVTLPFVLLLMDYWPLERFKFAHGEQRPGQFMHEASSAPRLVLEKAPLFALAAGSCVATFLAQQSWGAISSLDKLPLSVRMANALVAYVTYMGKMIWPVDLAVIYPHAGMLPMWQVAGAGLLLLTISLLVVRTARQFPYLVVGWLWYLGTLVPVIGLVQVGKQSIADRYTYVPLIGLFIMIAWGIAHLLRRWSHRKVILGTSASILLLALAICARWQVLHWRNGIVLFTHSVDVTTNNYVAHDTLGVALARQGRLNEAIAHCSEALRIRPNYAEAHNNLGAALALQGRLEEAIAQFSKAVQIDPTLAQAHKGMGLALTQQGRLEEAIPHYSKALESKPDDPAAHNDLGIVLVRIGRLEEAIVYFSKALRMTPNNEQVRDNLRRALRLSGKSGAASNTLAGH